MKFGDDFYGWGVFDIPIEREPPYPARRQTSLNADPVWTLWHDVPWKGLGASVLLSILCLAAILLLERNIPKPPVPSEPQPVEVAVRIPLEVPGDPPPLAAELPAPLPDEKIEASVREDPQPVPQELRPVREVPSPPIPERTVSAETAKPPETMRLQPPPADVRLPPPSPQAIPTEAQPQERPALPEQKTQVAEKQEAVLPEPARSSYGQRSTPAPSNLPKRTASLRKETAALDPGEGPKQVRAAERGTDAGALPGAPAIALKGSGEAALKGAEPRMNTRYGDLSERPAASLPPPERTAAPAGGGEDILLPRATVLAPPGSRKAVATLRPAERNDTSLAGLGRKADPDLPGPSVRTASLKQPSRSPEAPGSSYEYLDLVGPADLDPSVMVSLDRLRTCLDPNEELTLKTRLAAMLSRSGQCRSGGVVFDIRHPESAYSIHIDLYNYEQRDFQDRCSALRLAVYSCEARR